MLKKVASNLQLFSCLLSAQTFIYCRRFSLIENFHYTASDYASARQGKHPMSSERWSAERAKKNCRQTFRMHERFSFKMLFLLNF